MTEHIDIEKNEADFQEAQKVGNYEKMFLCVYKACKNLCISIYHKRSFLAPEDLLEEVAVDATMMCMDAVKNKNVKIDKLSSYCYLRCVAVINRADDWDKKQQRAVDFVKSAYSKWNDPTDCSNILDED